jgi:hypothetical protein
LQKFAFKMKGKVSLITQRGQLQAVPVHDAIIAQCIGTSAFQSLATTLVFSRIRFVRPQCCADRCFSNTTMSLSGCPECRHQADFFLHHRLSQSPTPFFKLCCLEVALRIGKKTGG